MNQWSKFEATYRFTNFKAITRIDPWYRVAVVTQNSWIAMDKGTSEGGNENEDRPICRVAPQEQTMNITSIDYLKIKKNICLSFH